MYLTRLCYTEIPTDMKKQVVLERLESGLMEALDALNDLKKGGGL